MNRTSPAHSTRPLTGANSAALILLRIGLITVALLASLFLLLTQTHGLPFGTVLVYAVGGIGFLFLAQGLRDLLRELNRQTPGALPRTARSH